MNRCVILMNGVLPIANMVTMLDWTCIETDKQCQEYKYVRMKNMKVVEVTEYIAFEGLPPISTLIKPQNSAK
jgi:hypothetical protein